MLSDVLALDRHWWTLPMVLDSLDASIERIQSKIVRDTLPADVVVRVTRVLKSCPTMSVMVQ